MPQNVDIRIINRDCVKPKGVVRATRIQKRFLRELLLKECKAKGDSLK